MSTQSGQIAFTRAETFGQEAQARGAPHDPSLGRWMAGAECGACPIAASEEMLTTAPPRTDRVGIELEGGAFRGQPIRNSPANS